MADISNLSSATSFAPINSLQQSSVEDISEQVLTKGVNLAQLIAKTYSMVEQHSQNKAHLKIDELEAHQKKLENVTRFLTTIESQLSTHGKVDMSHPDHIGLVEEMRILLPEMKLLQGKTSWNREDAEIIKTGFTRHSQIIMQQVHHLSSDVNRAIEEGTELLQIARKCLEMLDRLHQTFTSNQRGR